MAKEEKLHAERRAELEAAAAVDDTQGTSNDDSQPRTDDNDAHAETCRGNEELAKATKAAGTPMPPTYMYTTYSHARTHAHTH